MITTHHISDAPLMEVKTWIRNNAHGKHSENYRNIELNSDHKAISIERYDGKNITCVSTIYNRDYYPEGCVRIFNKWLAIRKIGGTKKNILSDRAIQMATQQIYFSEMMGYTSFFISYHSYIPKFCNELTLKLNEKTEWNWNHEELVRVAPGNNKKCYQHVIYAGEGIEKLINRKMDIQTWRSLC